MHAVSADTSTVGLAKPSSLGAGMIIRWLSDDAGTQKGNQLETGILVCLLIATRIMSASQSTEDLK